MKKNINIEPWINYLTTSNTTIKSELLMDSALISSSYNPKESLIIFLYSVYSTRAQTKWDREREFVPPLSIRPLCSTIENQSETQALAVPCVIFLGVWVYFLVQSWYHCNKMDFILVQKAQTNALWVHKVSPIFIVSRAAPSAIRHNLMSSQVKCNNKNVIMCLSLWGDYILFYYTFQGTERSKEQRLKVGSNS